MLRRRTNAQFLAGVLLGFGAAVIGIAVREHLQTPSDEEMSGMLKLLNAIGENISEENLQQIVDEANLSMTLDGVFSLEGKKVVFLKPEPDPENSKLRLA